MANNAITQMLYVVQMKMIPVTFVLGVRNPPRSSHFCLSHHRKKKKENRFTFNLANVLYLQEGFIVKEWYCHSNEEFFSDGYKTGEFPRHKSLFRAQKYLDRKQNRW